MRRSGSITLDTVVADRANPNRHKPDDIVAEIFVSSRRRILAEDQD
jgi:hypothetical protein